MARTPGPTRDASLAGGTAVPSPVEPAIFEADTIVAARYRLIRLIARGGMGEVYEALDLELGTPVAIKTIRAERIGRPDAAARLKQEILAARRVTHPNVIRLFDVGFHVLPDQREVAFFTMELLAGQTLDARIRDVGRLPRPEILALARQMAAGLDALHAAGIVHRDFKSQNVIVVDGKAIVTDLGLARDHGPDAKTTVIELVGTPAYMAPEQVARDRPVGPAADIYAFGVVLYEMVTGALPYARDTALGTAVARLDTPPPPPRDRVPDLPAAWNAAILRCLRRAPERRFARAGDVVAALARRAPVPWRAIGVAVAALAVAVVGYRLAVRGGSGSACGPPRLPDIYVDGGAAAGGTGASGCPLRTITAALAVSAERKVVHVAAGFYDRAHGERFPLELRGEVTVIGAGPDQTTIAGVGAYDGRPSAGTVGAREWQGTVVAGDATRTVELAAVSLTSGLGSGERDVVGVLCTRGTADGAANTRLRGVVVGPGYSIGVVAGAETRPAATGCNLEVTGSRLHDGVTGIWQVGCGVGDGRVGARLAVHDSRFVAFRSADPVFPGTGISVWDCARELIVDKSGFYDSDTGMIIVRHDGEVASRARIIGNDFDGLGRAGLMTSLAVLAEIRDNRFINVTGRDALLGRAAALKVYVDGATGPQLVVRGNRFVENDVGLEIGGIAPLVPATDLDLGRPDDPGGNTFFCNAAPDAAPVPGGDVAVRVAAAPGAHLRLAGNVWDHDPPTTSTTAVNGLDVLVVPRSPLALDTSKPSFHGREHCIQRRR